MAQTPAGSTKHRAEAEQEQGQGRGSERSRSRSRSRSPATIRAASAVAQVWGAVAQQDQQQESQEAQQSQQEELDATVAAVAQLRRAALWAAGEPLHSPVHSEEYVLRARLEEECWDAVRRW